MRNCCLVCSVFLFGLLPYLNSSGCIWRPWTYIRFLAGMAEFTETIVFWVITRGKVKIKCTLVQALRLCTSRAAHRGSRGIAVPFLYHGTRRGWGVSVTPRPLFTPGESPGTHCTGGWVGPRAGLDRCGKSRLPPGFDPQTVQPIASRYTNYDTRPVITRGRVVVFQTFRGDTLPPSLG
jgi:hypothetical protein